MRLPRSWRLAAGLSLFVTALTAQSPFSGTLVIRGVTLIDGTGTPPRPGVSVVVAGGKVSAIVPAGEEPEADLSLNGRGLFAMPGLIDAHVHLSGMRWEARAEQRRVLSGGVTALFDVAGDVRTSSDLARASAAGEIEAPSITYVSLMAGPAFFTDPRVVATSLGYTPGEAPWNRVVTAQTDLTRAIAAAGGGGATAIKLYAALDGPTVKRIGDEAKRQQMRLIAHSTVFPAKPSDLVAAGVKMLAHTAYLAWEGSPPTPEFPKRARGDFAGVPADGPVIGALLQSMKANDVALNPTLWIFTEGPASKDDLSHVRTPWMHAVTKRAQDIGVTLAAGTDGLMTPGDPLPTLHKELEISVKGAGLTPLQAIVSATRGAAHAMGIAGVRGTLEPGKAADIVLLTADPSADITNTRRISYVLKNGRIVFDAPTGGRQ